MNCIDRIPIVQYFMKIRLNILATYQKGNLEKIVQSILCYQMGSLEFLKKKNQKITYSTIDR